MFETLSALFLDPLVWIVGWLPHIGRLDADEFGIKIGRSKVAQLDVGFYWYVPNAHKIRTCSNQLRTVSVGPQTLYEHRVAVSATYRVTDPMSWLYDYEEPEQVLCLALERATALWADNDYNGSVIDIELKAIELHQITRTDFCETTARDHFVTNGMVIDE